MTDHDHFGIEFVDASPELWSRLQSAADAAHDPGRFVTVFGYEWTSWIHGHRHVLHFDERGGDLPLHSSLAPTTDDPSELWEALRGRPSLTVAHHSSGDPVPVDWDFTPDPELEPVTEVVSVHGQSEAADAPGRVAGSRPGQYVRDALARGYRLGFVGSGDSHDGHPGLAHLSPVYGYRAGRLGRGGLAGLYTAERTRAGVLNALRARRCYATSGPRIVVHASLAGHLPGERVDLARGNTLEVSVYGTAPLAKVDLVRSDSLDGPIVLAAPSGRDARYRLEVRPLEGDHAFLYVRILQVDGGAAWVGPWFSD